MTRLMVGEETETKDAPREVESVETGVSCSCRATLCADASSGTWTAAVTVMLAALMVSVICDDEEFPSKLARRVLNCSCAALSKDSRVASKVKATLTTCTSWVPGSKGDGGDRGLGGDGGSVGGCASGKAGHGEGGSIGGCEGG
jgi:hypothetical protein